MKPNRSLSVLAYCIAALGIGHAQSAPELQGMLQAANGFYSAYQSFRPPDGIPDAVSRARFEPYISPALDRLLVDAAAAQAHFAQVTKKPSPPLVDGDAFTPNFEGATSFKIGSCVQDIHGGHCAVALAYDNRRDKPTQWNDTVLLMRMNEGWRVDDVVYGDGKGRLTDTLKGAIEAGNGAKE